MGLLDALAFDEALPWIKASPNRATAARAIGIDLGTTTSIAAEAVWSPHEPSVVRLSCIEFAQETVDHGVFTDSIVPSAVALFDGKLLIGEGARRLAARGAGLGLAQNRDFFLETKNEIGTRRAYGGAPEGFRAPADIAGHVLAFLADGVRSSGGPIDRWVVTVPASFQSAQRADTLIASERAGLHVGPGDLLDEPVAAFIDYVARNGADSPVGRDGSTRLLVFDFGGGTTDVAIFDLTAPRPGAAALSVSPRSVSRYHRLGGGDIDAAIAYEILLPQLAAQNGLGRFDLDYQEKKQHAEPALRAISEALKIGLCREVDRLRLLGRVDEKAAGTIEKVQPGVHSVPVRGRQLKLASPSLTLAELRRVAAPFFDVDLVAARRDEFRMTASIAGPIQDAVARAGLAPAEIGFCLAVGGSCGLPDLADALRRLLPRARFLEYDRRADPEANRLCVARGAALHALAKALTGEGLVRPVCGDTLALKTQNEPLTLIERGTSLPFPDEIGTKSLRGLAVPVSSEIEPVTMRVEVVAGEEQRPVFAATWKIEAPVSAGEPLKVETRMDANQVLELRLRKAEAIRAPAFVARIENPLTNVVNPAADELEAEQIETELQARRVPPAMRQQAALRLVRLLNRLGRHEKALGILKAVQAERGRADADLLNLMGLACFSMGDDERAAKYYGEAGATDLRWGGPHFNLALLHKARGRLGDAVAAAEESLRRSPGGAGHALRAELADRAGDAETRDHHLKLAMKYFQPLRMMDEWELGWCRKACLLAGVSGRLREVEEEQARRGRSALEAAEGVLPVGRR